MFQAAHTATTLSVPNTARNQQHIVKSPTGRPISKGNWQEDGRKTAERRQEDGRKTAGRLLVRIQMTNKQFDFARNRLCKELLA